MNKPPKKIFLLARDGDLYTRILPGCGKVALAWPSREAAEAALDVDADEWVIEYRPVTRRTKK
jgi:ribosome-associated toxin RatA of RatAB toxin-antitoxin module